MKTRLKLVALEARLAPSAARENSHVDDHLWRQFDRLAPSNDGMVSWAADGRAVVTVTAVDPQRLLPRLVNLGFTPVDVFQNLHFLEGYLPISALPAVDRLGDFGLLGVLSVAAPQTDVGVVTSQADDVLETARTRLQLPSGFNGAGLRIGVLSDSYDKAATAVTHAADDVTAGDLPAGIIVIDDSSTTGSDEGRAMMQLAYDLAPGVNFAFGRAGPTQGAFANNIRSLADPAVGKSQVIVDDIIYFDEPFFQDGVIAQAIDEVVATRGVNYLSSAGNRARRAYESTSFTTGSDTAGATAGQYYDFDPGPGVDTRQRITIANTDSITLALQWNDPFYTASGVDTDLDFYLINSVTGAVVASSTSNNLTSQSPIARFSFSNDTTTTTTTAFDVMIRHKSGPAPGRIKFVNFDDAVTFNEFATNSPTVNPHAGAASCIAVGAASFSSIRTAESFSSAGPTTILFQPDGTPLASATVRDTPRVLSIDGCDTSFFGSTLTSDGTSYKNFFGTSAAAPQAAAVVALIRQANPTFTPAQAQARLESTADASVSTAGFDNLTGWGLINAYDAVFGAVVPAGLPFTDGFESGALGPAWETFGTGASRIRVTGSFTPFAGSKHLTLDESRDTTSGRNEVTLHIDGLGRNATSLSFRQREYSDDDQAMSTSFTTGEDTDGVAFSVDGTTWYRLITLTGANSSSTYTQRTYDLKASAAAQGLTLSADTRIRFQQFDNNRIDGSGSNVDGFAFDEISVTDPLAPAVTLTQINDGSAQRSRVLSVTVSFDELVQFPGGTSSAFSLTGPGGPVALTASTAGSTATQTKVTLTFSGPGTEFGSLADGRYTLTALASGITDRAGNALPANVVTQFHRLFGDADGDATVTANDFLALRLAFLGSSATFDYDGSGQVDANDLLQFRLRFLTSV